MCGKETTMVVEGTLKKGALTSTENEIPYRDEESDERRAIRTPPDLAETVRSLMVELQSCKADNERMMKEQEKQTEINAVLLQSLSDLQ
jgi:hypothetical protein